MSNRSPKHLNAVKHGAFAKTAILPGEDPAEFEELHSALIEEWKPAGPTEEDAVLSIAKGMWRKRRAQKLLQAQIERRRFDPKELLYDEAQRIRRFLSIIDTAPLFTLVDAAPQVFKPLYDTLVAKALPVHQARYLEEKCPRKNFKSGSEWLQALRNEITSAILPALNIFGEAPDALLGRAAEFFTPELVKQELAVDERIDAMLDRAVKRLVQTKAMKQMLPVASPHGNGDLQQLKPIRAIGATDRQKSSTTNAPLLRRRLQSSGA
jgi:uncharacterized protein (DUF2384 family)